LLTKNISLDLHSFIEATLDSDRLKLISFLTEEPFSVLDLAEKIGGNPAAIMRHLEVLVEANLVKATDQNCKTVYRFDFKKIELMARRQLSQTQMKSTYLHSTCLKTIWCSSKITLDQMAA
jgi:DNA-binding transcriptional ArsR family regulator